MKRAILSCNGLDKPEGSVAREVAIRGAAATGGDIICPVLLNRAPARYRKALSESSLIVVDGCSTRCATRLAARLDARVERKVLVSDAVKASGQVLESSLSLGPGGFSLAQAVVDELVRNLNAPAADVEPAADFETPAEFLIVTHDKFEFRIPVVDYAFNENDVWARVLDGVARVGISDYMQQKLTDISYFDPPKIDAAVEQFGELGTAESAKAVFEIIAPVSGTVVAVNPAVIDNPGLINEDPYGAGWLVELRLTAWPQDQELLLDPTAYSETVKRKAAEE
jgi:glycine cleavage system H protein